MATKTLTALTKLQELRAQLNEFLIERETMVDLLLVGLITKHAVFLGGEPGEGKTFAAQAVANALRLSTRYHLFSADTMPDEFLGSVDLLKLQEGIYTRDIEGGLATCEMFIADELFKSNSPSRNVQLGILNERAYQNGKQAIECPLQLYVGMSNELPTHKEDRAFWDRMLLRHWVKPVSVAGRRVLMQREAGIEPIPKVSTSLTVADVEELRALSQEVKISESVLEKALETICFIESEGISVSTRQCNQVISLLKAYALIQGRTEVGLKDQQLFVSMFWDKQEQSKKIEQVLSNLVGDRTHEAKDILSACQATCNTLRSGKKKQLRELVDERANALAVLNTFNAIADQVDAEIKDKTAEALSDLLHLITDLMSQKTHL